MMRAAGCRYGSIQVSFAMSVGTVRRHTGREVTARRVMVNMGI